MSEIAVTVKQQLLQAVARASIPIVCCYGGGLTARFLSCISHRIIILCQWTMMTTILNPQKAARHYLRDVSLS